HTGDLLFFDAVKAAAMNHPHLLFGLSGHFLGSGLLLKFHEATVEPGEKVGGADPHDAGENVNPADNQLRPFVEIEVHGISSFGRFVASSCEKGEGHSSTN
ncbi:MAG: hypothetical protein QOJ40_1651, partial [Verrucomicrobiota bacterium]